MKQNYQKLSSEQKQKIGIDESEIVFTYPYLIGIIMDEQTSKDSKSRSFFFFINSIDSFR